MTELQGTGSAAEQRRYYGKYPGLVLDNAPAADAEHLGRIQVEVPGILEETPDGAAERSVQLLAKPCFPNGFFFIPETGQQVWVEFAAGDINEPLWSGAWYPEGATPRTVADAAPTAEQKIIRTVSGHVVQLDDTSGEEKVVITHRSGSFMSIDQDGTVVVGNHLGSTIILNARDANLVIVDQHANSVQMTDEGITAVQGDGGAAVHLGKDLVRVSGKTIALEGATVGVGKDASMSVLAVEPAIAAAWAVMWPLFQQHVHPTGVGPSGPPVQPCPDVKVTSVALVK